jgi:DNA-binding IclR family transcriptional regulator
MMLPASCSAAGRVLLAGLQEEEQGYAPVRMFPGYPHVMSDHAERSSLLYRITEQGYALEDEESDAGVRSIAAPIRDYNRFVVGAISVSGPATRFGEQRLRDELIPMVTRAAAEISGRLGYASETNLAKTA